MRSASNDAEFPVLSIVNPRMAVFTLLPLSTAEARSQHCDMPRHLGAARDTLWISVLTHSMAERNRRAIWWTTNQPGKPALRPQMS